MEGKKKVYSKPVIKNHGNLKKVTKEEGSMDGDIPQGSNFG